jgi:uncharacterized membrane protein
MANLVVLGFDDRASAERVFQLVTDTLPKQQLLQVGDAALVWREQDGKPRIQQAVNTTAAGALGGAFWGTLIGLLFLNPLLGAAVGAGAGAIGGKLTDIGINDSMIKEMGQDLEPGKAAVFALVQQATQDRVIEAIKPYNPHVIQTSLSHDDQEALAKALQA